MVSYSSTKVLQRITGIIGICSIILYFRNSALAQIIPDESLRGVEQSRLTNDIDIKGSPGDLIKGGAVRGNNLFHSFSEFNVNEGERVYFANPGEIKNIISRVTGNYPSSILGTLGIDDDGSLFLINPNGIVFGENARLDIAGSFIASTAKSLVFENGFEFSTENPNQPPVLTINIPIGLQLGANSGEIVLMGSGILGTGLTSTQTIGLIANGITSNGGVISAEQIEIASVSDEIEIGVISQDSGFIFNYNNVEKYANIKVSNNSLFFTIGGDLKIIGLDIILQNNSDLFSFSGGNLNISGRNINISDGSDIAIFEGKNLTISGKEINIVGSGNSYIYSEDSEDLTIKTDRLYVNGAFILKSNGQGELKVEATNFLEVVGVPFQPFSGSIIFYKDNFSSGIGDANLLIINTENLSLRDGGQIIALTDSLSPGSNILINATESIEITGKVQLDNDNFLPSQIIAASGSTSLSPGNQASEEDILFTGAGGNLRINTGTLTVSNGGEVTVRSTTSGDAGLLTIAADSIFLDNQGKITATSDKARGGNIDLTASDLLLMRRDSLISAQSFGSDSQDGNITIDTDFVVALPFENSDIIARATNQGNIDVTANSVIGYQFGELTPYSDITASGTLTLNIPNLDPTKGLTELPGELVDSSQQIDRTCAANEEDESQFTVTGRNGLPQSPNELLTPDMVLDEFGTLATGERDAGMRVDENAKNSPTTPSKSNSQSPTPNPPQQIVEAQGWVVNAQGQVTLVAEVPNTVPHTLAINSAVCQTP